MAGIERAQRTQSRIVKIVIRVALQDFPETTRTLVGVIGADAEATRIAYVFTSPENLRGTALLIHDSLAPDRVDRTWVYVPSLGGIQELGPSLIGIRLPGSGLTYADSRGWIATDQYHFVWAVDDGADGASIEARPNTETLIQELGYSRLLIRVDRSRRVASGVVYYGIDGDVIKTYEVSEFVQHGTDWFPAQAG